MKIRCLQWIGPLPVNQRVPRSSRGGGAKHAACSDSGRSRCIRIAGVSHKSASVPWYKSGTAGGIGLLCVTAILAACTPTWQQPAALLQNGMALYELPMPAELDFTAPVKPGRYRVAFDLLYTETPQEAALRCNSGIPGGKRLACLFSNAKPVPLMVVALPQTQADWAPMCHAGHEVLHLPFGAWHR